MMVRPVCRPHVEDIKKQLVAEPTKLVTTVPCLINPTSVSSKKDFQAISVKQYQLYTLGGNHIRTACKDLLNGDQLSDPQKTINVDLYCDLTTTEARRIGNRHNFQSETLPLSFTDKVRQARRLLYEMSELEEDDDPPRTTPANFPKRFQSEMAMDHKVLMHIDVTSKSSPNFNGKKNYFNHIRFNSK